MKKTINIRILALGLFMLLSFFGYSRQGTKLYSIQNNSPWNSSLTWSKTIDGVSSGLVPQSNDTVVINKSIILNVDFVFSTSGMLVIENSGLLKAENFNLTFSSNSVLEIYGELRVNTLTLNDQSLLQVANNAYLNVFDALNANNNINTISGKVNIQGIFSSSLSSVFLGTGTIQASTFAGNGLIMGVLASTIPNSSLLTQSNWIGAVSDNWNETQNWSNNTIPTINSNVAILALGISCKINNDIECSKLTLNSNAELQVLPLALLQVNNSLTVIGNGKLTLKNTSSERSSLITNGTVSGQIRSEYSVTGKAQELISSPVKSAPSGTFLNMFLRTYNENNSQWGEYITPTNTALAVMQGYELQSLYNETRIFEGTPNAGSIISPVTANGNGLNLTGNPYPCYIDWEDNTKSSWQREKIASAIYYPDPNGSGNYAVYLPGDEAISINNGSRFIKPMQGFFVKANTQGNIVVKESSRKAYMNDSKASIKNNSIRIKLTCSTGNSDESVFRVIENASEAFDNDMDALKISGNAQNASLFFTDLESNKLSINTIPSISSSTVVPLSVTCSTPGTYTLSTQGVFDFEYRYPVLLRDKQLNTLTNLRSDSSYTFQHSPTYNANRFEIVFISPEGIEDFGVKDLTISQANNSVHVEGSTNEEFEVRIFDLSGKVLAIQKGIPSNGIDIGLNIASKIVLVRLSNGNRSYTQKVYFNK